MSRKSKLIKNWSKIIFRCTKTSTVGDQLENVINKLAKKELYYIEKEIPAILDNDICFLKEEVLKKVLKGAIEEIVSMFNLNVTIEKMEELGLNATDESKNIIVWSRVVHIVGHIHSRTHFL